MKKLILLLLIIQCLVSCKKETTYTTIYPLPYLPVYPGSFWRYLNKNNDTIIQSTDSEYKLHHYACEYSTSENTIWTDYVYVPYWNGNPIYGYSTPYESNHYYSANISNQVGFLSNTLEQSWGTYFDPHIGSAKRTVKNIDTSLNVNSSIYLHVIKVRETYRSTNLYFPKDEWLEDNYYAKDVGLVLRQNSNDTLSLISFYINR